MVAESTSLKERTAQRAVAERKRVYVDEIDALIEATYRVIERTGEVDPTVRQILTEAGLSTPAFYRHFRSKDELFVVIIDDGRRRLASTVERRIQRASTGVGRLRAWINGVLVQASDPVAAGRTRPFVTHLERLRSRYPAEQRESERVLIDQLSALITASADLTSPAAEQDAAAIYHMTIGVLSTHLLARTAPTTSEIEHLVDFAKRALTLP
ncbi:MAG TPA: TetR/AcrR family transcriptional regulator [Ilumatobacteraceae bacterium]|nr:TetR/AcrR family transcriptional regulator [Ilumatobacteraceae bacterium]